MADITFNQTPNFIEFQTESRERSYIIRIHPNGREDMLVNLRLVSAFIRSPLVKPLVQLVDLVRHKAILLMNEPDETTRKSIWWDIHDFVKQRNSNFSSVNQ